MAKYKTKISLVEAIQYTGKNTSDVLSLVGFRTLDLKGDYEIPNFVVASNWLSWAQPADWAVWASNGWSIVPANSWIIKTGEIITVLDNASFISKYEIV